jgi:hypothetical protein
MFRFTIRDVLWLMVVVGLVLGWSIDHAVIAWNRHVSDAKFRSAENKLNDLGWQVRMLSNGREMIIEPIYRPAEER